MSYVRHLLTGIALLSLFLGGLNLFVDPFDIFGIPHIKGFNTNKSIGIERLSKPLQATARRPETIILGTSRCMSGVDPRDIDGDRTYNLSVAGALAGEMIMLARHAAETTPMQRLILCFDFVAFNDTRSVRNGFYSDVLGRYAWLKSLPRTLFSYSALKRSRNTLRDSLRGKHTAYRSDGFRAFQINPRQTRESILIAPIDAFLSPGGAYRNYPSFREKLAAFGPLIHDLRSQGISVDILIPPVHATMLEAIGHAGLWQMFEDWKRGIAAFCADASLKCWDFADYNVVTMTALDQTDGIYSDVSHFTPEIGRRMLNSIAGLDAEQGFGTPLTPERIKQHLANIRTARSAYLRSHADDAEIVRAAAARYGLQ
jgi:hypothetical protein|tara:strand:+ start:348 stop:1460 length:1113 start_codon:yes stop_codon:yes gene_type:complete